MVNTNENIKIWKAQFEFRSDSNHILKRLKGEKLFHNDNGYSFSTFLDRISHGLFQGSLQQQRSSRNANNNNDDEIFASLLERKDELIFEVDRVNKLTKHDCYNGNNDNNAVWPSVAVVLKAI